MEEATFSGARRPEITMSYAFLASEVAMPNPIPRDPPVIRATIWFSSFVVPHRYLQLRIGAGYFSKRRCSIFLPPCDEAVARVPRDDSHPTCSIRLKVLRHLHGDGPSHSGDGTDYGARYLRVADRERDTALPATASRLQGQPADRFPLRRREFFPGESIPAPRSRLPRNRLARNCCRDRQQRISSRQGDEDSARRYPSNICR